MRVLRLRQICILAMGVFGCGSGEVTAPVALRVASFAPGAAPVPIEAAEVCVLNTEVCELTDLQGRLTVEVSGTSETAVTITADGFNPTVSAIAPGLEGERQISVLRESLAELLLASLGIDYPLEDRGVIAVTFLSDAEDPNSGIPGATLGLDDPEASLYYLDEQGFPVVDRTATSQPLGTGGFVEVSPGTREIELDGTTAGCTALAAWPTGETNRVRAPVIAGFFTDVLLLCETPD